MITECDVPVIHNWREFATYRGPGSPTFIIGSIYNDVRANNGEDVRTSEVRLIDRKNGILVTKNTTYYLAMESTESI
jgi:hypothetical protein